MKTIQALRGASCADWRTCAAAYLGRMRRRANRKLSRRSRTISTSIFLMSAPFNSIRRSARTAADQGRPEPSGCHPVPSHRRQGILFLDELTSAPQMTQAGCYQLVLDRKLGEYVLPEGWVVIAAGNPASERGVHFAMPRPLRNRFVHLELESRPERLVQVGRGRGRAAGDHRLSALQAGPAARGRHNLGRQRLAHSALLGDGFPCSLRRGAQAEHSFSNLRWRVRGAICSTEPWDKQHRRNCWPFLRLFRQLPSIDEILLNPESAPLADGAIGTDRISTALGRVMER